MPIEGVVLQMKSMGIDQVVNFPFPTPPDRLSLRKAEVLLQTLGALSSASNTTLVAGTQVDGAIGGQITALGRQMADYPVSPRFAKMLAIGNQHGAMAYIVAVVAGMSVGDPFIHESAIETEEEDAEGLNYLTGEDARKREERKEARKRYFKAQSVSISLMVGNKAEDYRHSCLLAMPLQMCSSYFQLLALSNMILQLPSVRRTSFDLKLCKRSNNFVIK